jgi:hypothetical protein
MIARGDLSVECGYERLAEVQEEILWAAEAAHIPVIWATQVLETLAKTGLPSRAEITDAAMGERAECVMLSKGPHIFDAIHTLDDILRRMQSHQHKKRALMRPLKAWDVQEKMSSSHAVCVRRDTYFILRMSTALLPRCDRGPLFITCSGVLGSQHEASFGSSAVKRSRSINPFDQWLPILQLTLRMGNGSS